VVKSNSKKAFDFFFDQEELIETDYLCQERLNSLAYVAEYCSSVVTRIDGDANPLKVIDVGCGTGHLLLGLSNRLQEPVRLYGLDFSDSAIRLSRRLVPSAQLVVASVYEIPHPVGSFDMVTCTETLEHLQRPEEALEEMLRVLKPGGQLIVTVPDGAMDEWDGHVSFWSAAELRHLLLPYGVQHVAPLPLGGDLLARATKHGGCPMPGAKREMPLEVLPPQ